LSSDCLAVNDEYEREVCGVETELFAPGLKVE